MLCPIKLNGDTLECVGKFCYLADMIGSGGGAEDASSMRVKCAWGKFWELSPILTARRVLLKLKKVYQTCIQSVLVYGSETWAMKAEDMQKLERTKRMMIGWMCSVNNDRKASVELLSQLDIERVFQRLLDVVDGLDMWNVSSLMIGCQHADIL